MHAFGPGRFRDGDVAVLEMPAEYDLRRGLAMGLSDADDRVVGKRFPVVAERAVGLDGDAVPPRRLARVGVAEVGVQLELIHDRCDTGLGDESVQVCGLEIGDAGASEPSLGDEFGQRCPGRNIVAAIQRGQGQWIKNKSS